MVMPAASALPWSGDFGSLYFGNWLDKKFGTTPYFTIIFLVIA